MERGFRSALGGRSLRNRWSLAFALVAGLTLSLALPVQAVTGTLDQSQTLTLGGEQAQWMAQTFTAGMTGQLDHVSLATYMPYGGGTVTIQSVTGTFPSGLPLGTMSFINPLTGYRQFHDFAFTPAISVKAGSHYAIVVKVPARAKSIWYDSGGYPAYAGGQLYIGSPSFPWATDPVVGAEFAFMTYVIGGSGSANRAPIVAADSPTVTVNEGTAPVMTGTFSDPDGDAVSVTASAGKLTQTGTSGGTWSWTQAASDEPSSQSVTITADDGRGLTNTTTFTAATNGVSPTVNISRATVGVAAAAVSSGAPVSSPEGTAINLNGSASSPSAEDNAAPFTYSWNVTKDGASFGTGTAAGFSFTPNDEGTYVATLQATDDGGMTGTSPSMTFIGTNVAPTAKITSVAWSPQLVLTAHQTVSFTGTFTDPSTLDTHTFDWKFGDGATGNGVSPAHAYNAAGTYTVTFTVTDDDNGVGRATTTVAVQTPQQALASITAYVQNLKGLNGGQKNSLMAKLNSATDSATRGNATAASNQLNAFLNELQTDLNSGRITGGDMTILRPAVQAVQAALGTYNRFLEWWPIGA
jgi:PKD repeat protein